MKRNRTKPRPLPATEPEYFSAQIREARRFYLDLSPSPSEQLAVVSGGVEHCLPDYHMRRPGFRCLAIEFVATGAGTLDLCGKRHRLSAGDVFAYGPRVPHDIETDADKPLVKYFVDFSGPKARKLLQLTGLEPGKLQHTSSPQDVLRLFENLIDAGLRPTPFRRHICSRIVEHILLRVAETSIGPEIIDTIAFETYQRCHHLIKGNFLKIHSLSDIADQCGLDASYLCRLFDRFDYEGPYQYLTRLKMIHAAEQLQVPGVLVKQVAAKCGFADPFSFSRTFRRVLGVSPKKFMTLLIS